MKRILAATLAIALASCGGGPNEPADCTTDWDCGCAEDCLEAGEPRSAIPQVPTRREAV